MKALFDWFASMIRTVVVPAIVGVLAAGALYGGTDLPPDTAALISTAFSFLYWAIVRLLEVRFPKAGWLLLLPRPPSYTVDQAAAFLRSSIRTFTPYLIGLVLALLARHGIELVDSSLAMTLIAALFGGTYYGGARALEIRRPAFGVLLGARGAPTYNASSVDVDEDLDG